MVRSWIKRVRAMRWPLVAALGLGATTMLAALLAWRVRIAYLHPGPALALGALGIAVTLVALVWLGLRADQATLTRRAEAAEQQNATLREQAESLAAQSQAFAATIDQLEALQRGQAATIAQLQRHADALPPIVGIELLVNRWQPDRQSLDREESALLFEQLRVALAVAREDYGGTEALTFHKVFAGAKPRGGAFLIQHGDLPPRVLKLDSQHNIAAEIDRYHNYVQQELPFTPGEPRACRGSSELGGVAWGAVTYTLIGNSGLSQLQTFGEYYASHDAQAVHDVLAQIFGQLEVWWDHKHTQPVETLYKVYDRLVRKLAPMQQALRQLGDALQIAGLQQISPDAPVLALDATLQIRNPLNWIQEVFGKQRLSDWIRRRYYSVVHGDLHMGNLLIEAGPGQISTWLIDFPHTGVGPTVRDLARLEADIACALMPAERLTPHQMRELAACLLADGQHITSLAPLPFAPDAELEKGHHTIEQLRTKAQQYLLGGAAPPYYLALLHATLPMVAYRDRSPQQKLFALIASALICEHLEAA